MLVWQLATLGVKIFLDTSLPISNHRYTDIIYDPSTHPLVLLLLHTPKDFECFILRFQLVFASNSWLVEVSCEGKLIEIVSNENNK